MQSYILFSCCWLRSCRRLCVDLRHTRRRPCCPWGNWRVSTSIPCSQLARTATIVAAMLGRGRRARALAYPPKNSGVSARRERVTHGPGAPLPRDCSRSPRDSSAPPRMPMSRAPCRGRNPLALLAAPLNRHSTRPRWRASAPSRLAEPARTPLLLACAGLFIAAQRAYDPHAATVYCPTGLELPPDRPWRRGSAGFRCASATGKARCRSSTTTSPSGPDVRQGRVAAQRGVF